jgi:hypothetical protein
MQNDMTCVYPFFNYSSVVVVAVVVGSKVGKVHNSVIVVVPFAVAVVRPNPNVVVLSMMVVEVVAIFLLLIVVVVLAFWSFVALLLPRAESE